MDRLSNSPSADSASPASTGSCDTSVISLLQSIRGSAAHLCPVVWWKDSAGARAGRGGRRFPYRFITDRARGPRFWRRRWRLRRYLRELASHYVEAYTNWWTLWCGGRCSSASSLNWSSRERKKEDIGGGCSARPRQPMESAAGTMLDAPSWLDEMSIPAAAPRRIRITLFGNWPRVPGRRR